MKQAEYGATILVGLMYLMIVALGAAITRDWLWSIVIATAGAPVALVVLGRLLRLCR